MTTLTIEIPDEVTEDVVKYLKEKDVIIKPDQVNKLDELTIEDYRRNFIDRTNRMKSTAAKHL